MARVICAISGGVDSAVAALLLKKRGLNITGVFMRNWDLRDELGHCNNDEDCEYANRVCKALNIPLYEINLVKEYWTDVFVPTIAEYENGNTPNADLLCNHHIKFDALHNKCARLFGSEGFVLATGHYAQTLHGEKVLNSQWRSNGLDSSYDNRLLISTDTFKDQTFFLAKIKQRALRQTYFPLGHMWKSSVKDIARNSEVSFTLQRKESMGICFIGKRDFSKFLREYLPPKPGKFICHQTGEVVGHHEGCYCFTVGQRAKISGLAHAYFVLHKDVTTGDVIVVSDSNHPTLYAKSILVDEPHWIRTLDPLRNEEPFRCRFRFMHQQDLIDCDIIKLEDGSHLVVLSEPRRALTVGQSAIFYMDDECLGAARIKGVGPSMYECRSHDGVQLESFRANATKWRELCERFGDLTNYAYACDDIIGYNLFKSEKAVS